MTIQEVIKSGKRVRRTSKIFCEPGQFGEVRGEGFEEAIVWQYGENKDSFMHLSPNDILADDWEVEEEKVEITETQFFKACERACRPVHSELELEDFSVSLAKELGFKL